MHDSAEGYALWENREPANCDEQHILELIDSLDGELRVEEDVSLPLTVDGEQVTVSGIVDFVHVLEDGVEIFDFMTDLSRQAEGEYRKQLSIVLSRPERVVLGQGGDGKYLRHSRAGRVSISTRSRGQSSPSL